MEETGALLRRKAQGISALFLVAGDGGRGEEEGNAVLFLYMIEEGTEYEDIQILCCTGEALFCEGSFESVDIGEREGYERGGRGEEYGETGGHGGIREEGIVRVRAGGE